MLKRNTWWLVVVVASLCLAAAYAQEKAAEKGKSTKLPFLLYSDSATATPYVASGWIGDVASIGIDEKCGEKPHTGANSMKCEFKAAGGYGGVVWQDPPNDWGDQAGGYDLTGATKLTFWARGLNGGEIVSFKMGIIGKDAKHSDSGSAGVENVTLTMEWKQYTIDLAGKNLSDIKTGFMWVLSAHGTPVTFFLDDIQYE